MTKRISIAVVVAIALLGGLVYLNFTQVLLFWVSMQGRSAIGPTQEVPWSQGPTAPNPSDLNNQPNIIFILADDLGINDISAFGGGVAGGRVPTTHIDSLAQDGVNFSRSYAGNATCAPSRAMLMTGRYPTRTGFEFTPTPPGFGRMVSMIGNEMRTGTDQPRTEYNAEIADQVPSFDAQGLPTEEVTVAEVLKEQGYHTVHIGKWHLGRENGSAPNDQGFDESLILDGLLYDHEDSPNVVNAELPFDPIDKVLWARGGFGNSFNGGEVFEPGRYLTDYWTDQAVKVIEANQNRPFFLYYAHWGPHTPLQASREDFEAVGDIEPHRLRVYAGMIRSVDRSVGRILAKLEETGLTENTLIVFSSDNGGAGYIGLDEVNAPYRGWKITFFEGGIRAPLFMKWPARIQPGTVVETPVAHIDVMPTLVEAAGGELPEVPIDGKSLLAAATGEGHVEREDNPLFWQSGYTRVVQVNDWKLQVEGRRDKSWLFNLKDDPTEQINLVDSHPEKLGELRNLLAQHQENRKESLYPSTVESPIYIDRHAADQSVISADEEYVYWQN